MAKITWLGHSAWFIEGKSHRLVVDPFLTGNPKATQNAGDVIADYVILTHGHGDHIGDGIAIAKHNGATVIANYEVSDYCERQGCQVHSMHIGGAHAFPFGRVKLTIAHHGSGIDTPGGGFLYGGNPCGVVITIDGKTIYHAGDTGLFLDMKLIGERDTLDVALLPIGDNYTMGADDAAIAAEFLKAKLAIPMHYNTFPLIEADPHEFVRKVEARDFKARVAEIGAGIEIP